MYLLYKDPDREGVRDETTLSSHESGTSNSVDKVEVAELRSRVSSLEKKLKEKDEQLEKVKLESKKVRVTVCIETVGILLSNNFLYLIEQYYSWKLPNLGKLLLKQLK